MNVRRWFDDAPGYSFDELHRINRPELKINFDLKAKLKSNYGPYELVMEFRSGSSKGIHV